MPEEPHGSPEVPPPNNRPAAVQLHGKDNGAPHVSAHMHVHHSAIDFRFLEQLKHRNVIRVAILYLVACWLILDPVHVVFHMLEVPAWANRLVVILMVISFPVILLFSWVYEMTPEGLKPTVEVDPHRSIRKLTARRLDRAIMVVLVLGIAYLLVDKFWLSKHVTTEHPVTVVAPIASTVTSAATVISEKSVAVLPFVDMSEKKDQEYFADGMAEEVLNLLAKIPGLTVIGRTSSFQFKRANQDLRAIGSKLGAAYLVEGSVRRAQDTIRVTAQLIDTRNGAHLWSGTYDRPVGDTLQVQDEITASLVRSLQVTVEADHKQSRRRSGNMQAYELYLRGRSAYERRDRDGLAMAATYFQQSLEIDPEFADAATGLSFSYYLQAVRHGEFEKARQAAEAAVRIDPALGEPHALLGAIHAEYDWDYAGADREFRTALALEPHDASVVALASQLQQQLGHDGTAIQMLKESLVHDPLLTPSYTMLAWIQARSGHFAEAEAAQRRALAIDPLLDGGHADLAAILLLRGDSGAALTENMRETGVIERTQKFALIYHALGRKAEADAALMTLTREGADDHDFDIAEVYAYRGERDRAFEWLDRAYRQRDSALSWFKFDPFLRNLEADPRYTAFLHKMNLPE
jgi:adenylate cyclase